MARIAQVSRADLAFCIVSFHEQILGCHAYIAKAKTSLDVVRGYLMFDRILSAFAAAVVLPFNLARTAANLPAGNGTATPASSDSHGRPDSSDRTESRRAPDRLQAV
jgi:hypothetical protein